MLRNVVAEHQDTR